MLLQSMQYIALYIYTLSVPFLDMKSVICILAQRPVVIPQIGARTFVLGWFTPWLGALFKKRILSRSPMTHA